jgi:uncharacterized membrane protein YphA (DoxX/SURF4 family)
MDYEAYRKYEPLILRVALGLCLLFLAYQKFTTENLADTFENLYGTPGSFVALLGVVQLVLGLAIILGLYTRVAAGVVAVMAAFVIVASCVLWLKHGSSFAYAFAVLGGAVVLFIQGSGAYSLDERMGGEGTVE